MELEEDGGLGVGGMLWCRDTCRTLGLSNCELKSTLNCTVWSQFPFQADGRTDGWTSRQ